MNKYTPIDILPTNNEHCLICFELTKGVKIEAYYNFDNQTFIVASSGLRIPAFLVISWEKITM